MLVLVAMFVNGLVTNPGWDWPTFAQYFTASAVLEALLLTIQLTFYGSVLLTKKDNGLVKAFADAINHTIENGTYQQVLDRWNLDREAVKTSEVNPPGLPKTAS